MEVGGVVVESITGNVYQCDEDMVATDGTGRKTVKAQHVSAGRMNMSEFLMIDVN